MKGSCLWAQNSVPCGSGAWRQVLPRTVACSLASILMKARVPGPAWLSEHRQPLEEKNCTIIDAFQALQFRYVFTIPFGIFLRVHKEFKKNVILAAVKARTLCLQKGISSFYMYE
jgi:hypothetical protein